MDERKTFQKGILCGIGVTVVVALVLFLAYQWRLYPLGRGIFEVQKEERLDVTNRQVADKMKEIEDMINFHYLNEVDEKKVEELIYTGMVVGLGDPYTSYYTVEDYQSLKDSTAGSYYGIGAVFSQNRVSGLIYVQKVYEGFPAHEAGMQAGDILYGVGEESVVGMDLTQVVSAIKGEEGTKVHLTMYRESEQTYLAMDVERRAIEIPTVEYEMLENGVGYVLVSEFDAVTSEQYALAIRELWKQGMKGLIVDLRGNGGGIVQTVCEMIDLMVPEGIIVYTEDKNGRKSVVKSGGDTYFDLPLVVLVNENSASASEIFAGAIKDYGIGTIVGTTTYGKGIVQQVFPLSDGTAVKMTISKYYTPKGNDIHEKGIEPDVVVELDEKLREQVVISREEDNQLQKAIEVLQSKF